MGSSALDAQPHSPGSVGALSGYLLALGVFKQLLQMFLLSAGSVRADFQIPLRGGFRFFGTFFLIDFQGCREPQTKPVEFQYRRTIEHK
jgi:hypothetical protein